MRSLVVIAILWLGILPAHAEDTVHVSVGEGARSRVRLTGEVLDYTGQTLLLRLPAGGERAFPADRVHAIETVRNADQQQADQLYREQRTQAALEQYRRALDKEERRWVRREIMAQIASCNQELGDIPSAVQFFMLLVQSDPHTPYFDCIPLAWLPAEPSPSLEELALKWLSLSNDDLAGLLGASHLLTGRHRQAARERLRRLSFNQDIRVAALARAQFWRINVATANDLQVQTLAAEVEKMPTALRAGPYFVLGEAWSARQQAAQAALAYLRVPILYPRDRRLSGRSLLEAGRQLEKIGQASEAASLYREVLQTHAQGSLAMEAQERLTALEPGKNK